MTENQRNTESLSFYERMQDPNLRLREIVTTIARIGEGRWGIEPEIALSRDLENRLGGVIEMVIRGHLMTHVRNLPQRFLPVASDIGRSGGVVLNIREDGWPSLLTHEHTSGLNDNYRDEWVGVWRSSAWFHLYQGILDRVTELE